MTDFCTQVLPQGTPTHCRDLGLLAKLLQQSQSPLVPCLLVHFQETCSNTGSSIPTPQWSQSSRFYN